MQQPGEPLWLPDDREKAVAWVRDERQRCPNCKQKPSDGVDPETKQPLIPLPMKAETHRCRFCEAIDREREALDKAAKDDPTQRRGTYQVLVPNPTATRREG